MSDRGDGRPEFRVLDAVKALSAAVPLRYAASWDNVGLLVGDPEARVSTVLVTVDMSEEVVREERSEGTGPRLRLHAVSFQELPQLLQGRGRDLRRDTRGRLNRPGSLRHRHAAANARPIPLIPAIHASR